MKLTPQQERRIAMMMDLFLIVAVVGVSIALVLHLAGVIG